MNQLDIDHSTAIDPTTLSLSGTSATITRVLAETPTFDDPSFWVVTPASAIDGYFAADAPTEQSCWWPFKIPHGATLTAIRLVVQGGAGHGDLPTPMPQFQLRSVTTGGTAATEVSPVADSSIDVTAFETVHAIEITGISLAMTNLTKRYTLIFTAEGSTDGQPGLKVFFPYVSFTMTNLDFE